MSSVIIMSLVMLASQVGSRHLAYIIHTLEYVRMYSDSTNV